MRDTAQALDVISRWADRHGVTAVAAAGSRRYPPGIEAVPLDEVARSEVLLAVGGDGTVLQALHLAASRGRPVLAVGLGHLGYLSDVGFPELDAALEALAYGRYIVEENVALDVRGAPRGSSLAFNDVVLRRRRRPAAIALRIDDELFMRYAGDGVIISTPAGSTAYSLSAGGPIVAPTLAATLVTPLAAHVAASRPLVLSADEIVTLDILPYSSPLTLEIDGSDRGEIGSGHRLTIGPSAVTARLIRVSRARFAARARSKLQLRDSPELAG